MSENEKVIDVEVVEEAVNPDVYFKMIKDMKHTTSDEDLDKFYDSSLLLLEKYRKLGQKAMLRKLMFIVDCIPKERELVKKGIDVFIYRDDIEEYINSVENKVVKIIELKNYPREIPDELVPTIDETRDIFDEYFVLFTDFTGKIERKVEADRRAKDPILFGAFMDSRNNNLNDRLYYLGDWEDEYCDLTLEKLVEAKGKDILKTIGTPTTKDELVEECRRYLNPSSSASIDNNNYIAYNNISYTTSSSTYTTPPVSITVQAPVKEKPGFFNKIRSFFGNKNE